MRKWVREEGERKEIQANSLEAYKLVDIKYIKEDN